MKLGWNLETSLDRFLSSWKSGDDPRQGEYMVKMDLGGYPQVVSLKGNVITGRSGPWNGLSFTTVPVYKQNPTHTFEFILDEKEIYFEFHLLNRTFFSRYILTSSGIQQVWDWESETNS